MNSVAILIQHRRTSLERLVRVLREHGLHDDIIRPYDEIAFPPVESTAAVVCLGGPMSAVDIDTDPVLAAEQDYLREAAQASVPVLGICLGSQLLAAALGGSAHPGEHGLEAGHIDVQPDPSTSDPVVGNDRHRYFSFHSDTFQAPPDAALLAQSDRYPQAFRLRNALGIQFHPEMSAEGIRSLIDVTTKQIRRVGLSPDHVLTEAEVIEGASSPGERLLHRWAHEVVQHPVPDPADQA